MANKERIEKVAKALKAYARIKASQHHICNKVLKFAELGRNEIGFHEITEASVAKLKKVGFKVTKGDNKPPQSIKYIISWKHF